MTKFQLEVFTVLKKFQKLRIEYLIVIKEGKNFFYSLT